MRRENDKTCSVNIGAGSCHKKVFVALFSPLWRGALWRMAVAAVALAAPWLAVEWALAGA